MTGWSSAGRRYGGARGKGRGARRLTRRGRILISPLERPQTKRNRYLHNALLLRLLQSSAETVGRVLAPFRYDSFQLENPPGTEFLLRVAIIHSGCCKILVAVSIPSVSLHATVPCKAEQRARDAHCVVHSFLRDFFYCREFVARITRQPAVFPVTHNIFVLFISHYAITEHDFNNAYATLHRSAETKQVGCAPSRSR